MANQEKIVISGLGLVTPVGHDSISSAAAIRAGIARFRPIPDFVAASGAQTVGGVAYGLTDDLSGTDRLLALAIPALQEALFSAEESGEDLDLENGRLLFCLGPSARPHYEEFEASDLTDLLDGAEAEALATRTDILRGGHSVAAFAMSKAVTLLRETPTRFCVIGAADSLVEYPVLAWLDEAGRLKTDQRSEGLIPGEAAAFVVLERESDARRRRAPPLVELLPPALAKEEAHLTSALPLRGVGLAEAVKAGLATVGGSVDGMICNLNGEYFRAKEWALALPQVFGAATELPELWHPAENIGDVGAATGVVLLAVAVAAIQRRYFPGPRIQVWTSSDDEMRSSVSVQPVAVSQGETR